MRIIISSVALLMLVGCTGLTYIPPEEQAEYYIAEAKEAFKTNNTIEAGNLVNMALAREGGDKKVKEFLERNPTARKAYVTYFENRITEIASSSDAVQMLDKLMLHQNDKVFNQGETAFLMTKLDTKVAESNASGAIPFVFGDEYIRFKSLSDPINTKLVLDRTISTLQSSTVGLRPMKGLMDYATSPVTSIRDKRRIESLLPTLNVRRDELDVVGAVFPNFVSIRRKQITSYVAIQFKSADRIIQSDITAVLRSRIKGVDWIAAPNAESTLLTIELIRNNEKHIPEQRKTVIYERYQVDTAAALFLMPRNATYIYDDISGGVEIEYGYGIIAQYKGKVIYDGIARGKVERLYHKCENSRIQNVFGGVSSADFMANNEMRGRCSGTQPVSFDEIRTDVYRAVAEEVLRVPTIKSAHEM